MVEKNIFKGNNVYYAHRKDDDKELLEDHLQLTKSYFDLLCDKKGLIQVFDKIYQRLFQSDGVRDLYYELMDGVVYYHDAGKINPLFQRERMKNFLVDKDIDFQNSNHSEISSWIYMRKFLEKIGDKRDELEEQDMYMIYFVLLINMGIIQGHHGSLKEMSEVIKNFEIKDSDYKNKPYFKENLLIDYQEDDFIEGCQEVLDYKYDKKKKAGLYIYARLLFGLLTQADILATMDYMNEIKTRDFGLVDNLADIVTNYNNNEITKIIRQYEKGDYQYPKNSINELRSDMFLEAESNLKTNKNIFTLEAPTGAGKTNISINLALKLLQEDKKLNKVFYAFPFNTLVEQTYNGLLEIFKEKEEIKKQISIYNSINSFEDLKNKDEETEEINYQTLYRDYQFLYYPIAISTNIKLFDCFFGNNKSSYYPLPLLVN
ncbi:MAG: CRISPR-associated endonuclease Cas3'', partial [Gallicola sp.]|nr:CRISPR-associated endonuclease Cas3'' [Gallicola sp.]